MQRYLDQVKIGGGSYGDVYKARDAVTGTRVAIKKLHLVAEKDGLHSTVLREVAILKEVGKWSPYVVQLIDTDIKNEQLSLVFEFIDKDLRAFLSNIPKDRKLSPLIVKKFIKQIIEGIHACHSCRLLHRDLKPENILVDCHKMTIRVADFGLGRPFENRSRKYTNEVVTLWYRCPELLLGAGSDEQGSTTPYNWGIDTWSIGCILGELVDSNPMFPGDCEIGQLFAIFKVLGTPSVDMWNELEHMPHYTTFFPAWQPTDLKKMYPSLGNDGIDLMKKLLEFNPEKRITAKEASEHPFLADV